MRKSVNLVKLKFEDVTNIMNVKTTSFENSFSQFIIKFGVLDTTVRGSGIKNKIRYIKVKSRHKQMTE